MKSITLTNDFHNTSVVLRPDGEERLTVGQVQRARRTLCGIAGCTCGGSLGVRGYQWGTRGLGIEMLYPAPARRNAYAARVFEWAAWPFGRMEATK